jgi:sulfate/thiosulfate transport system substrate-binding protein
MNVKFKAAVAASIAGLMALSACGGKSDASGGDGKISVVGFSVLQASYKDELAAFEKTAAGKGASFSESYGASGDQSRAVESGAPADLVHFSLEPDMTRLVGDKLVASDWNSGATKGIVTQSVVVISVRKGNPKNITGWDDLIKPGVQVVTPNPASSGSAKWNILAAYGQAAANGGDAAGQAYLTKLLKNTVAMPDSGRDATTAFLGGTGDVLLSYENEAITAKQAGSDLDYVVPDTTLLIQNPGAVTSDAPKQATDLLDFLESKDGQAIFAKFGFRPLTDVGTLDVQGANDPSNPFPQPKTLLTIDKDFGGWDDANTKYFDEENGIVTKLMSETGQG